MEQRNCYHCMMKKHNGEITIYKYAPLDSDSIVYDVIRDFNDCYITFIKAKDACTAKLRFVNLVAEYKVENHKYQLKQTLSKV